MMNPRLTIGWKVSTLNPALASLRYRAMLPILALESFRVESKVFIRPNSSILTGLDALVIVKSFNWEDYWLAQEAVKNKVPVIFDLCDNIFIDNYQRKGHTSPTDIFLLISGLANAIVVTTEPLATLVRDKTGGRIPIYVVPDGIETTVLLSAAKNRLWFPQNQEYIHRLIARAVSFTRQGLDKVSLLKTVSREVMPHIIYRAAAKSISHYLYWRFWAKLAYRYYAQLRAHITGLLPKLNSEVKFTPSDKSEKSVFQGVGPLAVSSTSRKIVWFGNHGAAHANFGMLDLLYIRESLEKLASEQPLELVVISNNLNKYNKYIRPMAIPSRYIEWNTNSVADNLHDAAVVVLPNSLDAFSICKSANRAVLALSHGVPVVATLTPALNELKECIVLDDFEGGLRRYLADANYAKLHVQQGKKCIERLYGQQVIGKLWGDLIGDVINNTRKQQILAQPEWIVAIHLPQDIDLIRPVIEEAYRQGVRCVAWSSVTALKRWPQLASAIRSLGAELRILPEDFKEFDVSMFSDSVYALLTVTETNLNPHKFTHHLTNLANSAGIFTATMQHGYENIGLSYSDTLHDIKQIQFAASKIYTWGSVKTLHPDIHKQTYKKCFPVGCPKPEVVERTTMGDWIMGARPVVGIFENLHWHRYSDDFRKFFLEGVMNLAKAFPKVDFLIKPHSAGMWLTSRYQGEKLEIDNLIIVDPQDKQWASITAPQLFGHLAAVITTPSTVALDAARAKIPTAVVAQGIDLENYEPLPLIHCIEDWSAFVNQAIDTHGRQVLQEKSQKFVDRVLLPGDAAWRIVKDIVSRKQEREVRKRY